MIDIIAVVGMCAPERAIHARLIARKTGRMLIPAERLTRSAAPLDEAAELTGWADEGVGAVIELPSDVPMTDAIGVFAQEDGVTRLGGIVCVVDASHLLADLRRDDYHRDPRTRLHIARAMLAVTHLEYASDIAVVGWQGIDTAELSMLLALISHLSPLARLRMTGATGVGPVPERADYGVEQERPGWVGVLSGEYDPYMTDPRVTARRYESIRPLHPQRLERLLEERIEPGAFGTVVRSAGFCRFATRPGVVGRWDHVGGMISFDPAARDEELALGQDLAFIGIDLDHDALAAALDDAALDDDELSADPRTWSTIPDPFPRWPVSAGRTE